MHLNLIFIKPSIASNGGNQEIDFMISGFKNSSFKKVISLPLFPLNTSKFASVFLFLFCYLKLIFRLRLFFSDYHIVLTHYSTYPLVILRIFGPVSIFVQDMEWLFVTNRILQNIIKICIMTSISISSRIIFANKFLLNSFTNRYLLSGISRKSFLYPVPSFPIDGYPSRRDRHQSVDETCILVVAKPGNHKRFSDYVKLVRLLTSFPVKPPFKFRLTVITPSELYRYFPCNSVVNVMPFQSKKSFLFLLANSHFFISLSPHEGFGINPLDSILCDCFPLLRYNGGCSNYLNLDFPGLLSRDSSVGDILNHLFRLDYMRRTTPNSFFSILDQAYDSCLQYLQNSLSLRDEFFRQFSD